MATSNFYGTAAPNGNVQVDGWLDNSDAQAYSTGVLSGFSFTPATTGFNVAVGGRADTPDVAILANPAGRKVRVGASGSVANQITLPNPPTTAGQAIAVSIVLYQDASAVATAHNGADTVGILAVASDASTNPTAPTDAQIRAAVPHGATAYVAVIGTTILPSGASGVSAITAVNAKESTSAMPFNSLYKYGYTTDVVTDSTAWVTILTVGAANFFPGGVYNISANFYDHVNGAGGVSDLSFRYVCGDVQFIRTITTTDGSWGWSIFFPFNFQYTSGDLVLQVSRTSGSKRHEVTSGSWLLTRIG